MIWTCLNAPFGFLRKDISGTKNQVEGSLFKGQKAWGLASEFLSTSYQVQGMLS